MGGTTQRSEAESKDLTPGEFRELRGPLADLFRQLLPKISGAFDFQSPATTGNLDAFRTPISQGELAGIDQITGQAAGSPNEALASDLLAQTLRGDFTTPGTNPALADVIRFTTQNINEQFNRQDLESRSLFARAGQRLPESSPFAQAQAQSNVGRLDAIGEQTANILFGNFEAERGRQVQAVEQSRANAQFTLQRSLQSLEANALPRLIDDLGIERGLQEFQGRLAALTQALGIGAGLASPTIAQDSQGKTKSGGVLSGSSERFKNNIAEMPPMTAELMALRPVTFYYNNDYPLAESDHERRRFGLIAEDVATVVPDVVHMDAQGRPDGIFYEELVPLLISAIQELSGRIDTLEGSS